MKKILFAITLGLLCTASVTRANTWPLNIGISQSSSFGEFRNFRFHAGIDLRTQRKCGFPVLAIEDGFISRASVQFTGYGYGLYVDHPSLKARAVYGHLQDFQGSLKKYIDAKLKKIGARHGINVFFKYDRFPVKKGEIIALSGETGSGPPHLHFEMRTFSDEPLAPALFGFRPADKIFPKFHHFYLEPLSYASVIDGSFLPKKYPLRRKNNSFYALTAIPEISGYIGIQIGVSDTNGAGNIFGVEKMNLMVNDKLLLERIFHRYSYSQGHQAPWIYDYFKSKEKGTGYVYTMFKWPFDTLPFAANYPAWSGVIETNKAIKPKINFKIEAEDFGKNLITTNGILNIKDTYFSENFPDSMISGYSFKKFRQTPFSLIAIGTNNSKETKKSLQSGMISCHDYLGKHATAYALMKGNAIEIALPKEDKWQNGAWIGKKRILPNLLSVTPKGGKIEEEAGAFALFAKNSVHFTTFCRLYRSNLKPAPYKNKQGGILKPFSPIWTFEPKDVVFDTEVKVSIRPHEYNGDRKKLGVYSVGKNGRYYHRGEKLDGMNFTFSTRIGGSFVILEDLVPPTLTYSRKDSHYHLGRVFVFRASDLGEGVNYLSAKATIDGKAAETYADPDKSEIYIVRPIASKQTVILSVDDYSGNKGSIKKFVL